MGAWIETDYLQAYSKVAQRRTLMGAWIETFPQRDMLAMLGSHPHGCVD